MAVVVREERGGIEAGGTGALERIGGDHRPGVRLAAVDAVGIGCDGMDSGRLAKAESEAGEELGVAAAAPVAADGYRRLAPRKEDRRRGDRLPPLTACSTRRPTSSDCNPSSQTSNPCSRR